MKYIFFILSIITSLFSCNKDDENDFRITEVEKYLIDSTYSFNLPNDSILSEKQYFSYNNNGLKTTYKSLHYSADGFVSSGWQYTSEFDANGNETSYESQSFDTIENKWTTN